MLESAVMGGEMGPGPGRKVLENVSSLGGCDEGAGGVEVVGEGEVQSTGEGEGMVRGGGMVLRGIW